MVKYYDDDGTEIQLDIKPEEIPKLKEQVELANKARIELETKQNELQDELKKLREKDNNFANLRKLSKEQQEEMLKDFTTKEKTIIEEMANIKQELSDYKERNFNGFKKRLLIEMAGSDDDLKKQIEDAYKGFAGEAKNEEEVAQRLSNAFTIVKGSRPNINPMNQFVAVWSNETLMNMDKNRGKRWTDTPEGKEFYEKNFPAYAPKKDNK